MRFHELLAAHRGGVAAFARIQSRHKTVHGKRFLHLRIGHAFRALFLRVFGAAAAASLQRGEECVEPPIAVLDLVLAFLCVSASEVAVPFLDGGPFN